MEVVPNMEVFFMKFPGRELRRLYYYNINLPISANIILPNDSCYVSRSSQLYPDYNHKTLFSVSKEIYEKYIVTQDFCVSTHDSFCFLENCKFHLVLKGTYPRQILQRLDKYQYVYQEIDCPYTLYKYRFYSSFDTSSGEVFNQLICGVQHTLRGKGA